jgi:hypothetical protein
MIDCVFLLYPEFETLDLFGPVEVPGSLIEGFSMNGTSRAGTIPSAISILTE